MESINYAKEISQKKLQLSPNILKIISLVFSGITGIFASNYFGVYFMHGGGYKQKVQINHIIGYICAACAIITIVTTVIFKNSNLVFMISTFITAILGSLPFFILMFLRTEPEYMYFLMSNM